DPRDATVIYAANQALWRSEDAGATWRMVFPDPTKNTVQHGWGDHADTVITTDDPLYPSGLEADIQAVAVDPAGSRHLALAMPPTPPGPPGSHPPGPAVVLVSTDRGRTWSRLGDNIGFERVLALWFEPGVLTALADVGTFWHTNGAWHALHPAGGERIQSGGFGRDAASGRTLAYATTAAGIWVSDDAALTGPPPHTHLPATPR